MNVHDLILPLNSIDKITIPLEFQIGHMTLNDATPIFLSHSNSMTMLANGPTYFNILDLHNKLNDILGNKLLCKQSAIDIGYSYNDYYFKTANLSILQLQTVQPLNDEKYCLWEVDNNGKQYTTWLYNNYDDTIVFEVTPFYPFFYCEKQEIRDYISYKKWIKTYQQHFTTILSQETAKQLLHQTKRFIEAVQSNIKN